MRLSGLPAIAFQHELDHLNGVMFYDRINKKDPFGEIPNATLALIVTSHCILFVISFHSPYFCSRYILIFSSVSSSKPLKEIEFDHSFGGFSKYFSALFSATSVLITGDL